MYRLATLRERLAAIRQELRDEYLQPHGKPWVVGFSAGKDSTLVLQLVLETLLSIPPDRRTRPVHVLSNDTLVESPIYQSWIDKCLDRVREGVKALRLPVSVVKTHPEDDATFWVNLLGRGYPAPNRNFRWCTDRMKIQPTTKFIRDRVAESGEVILILGVRRAESAARAGRINAYDQKGGNGRLNAHNDVRGCFVFRPIVALSDEDVWQVLLSSRPPWGGSHRDLVTLYRNAKGGECPFVVGPDDAPSCGTTSARLGWTDSIPLEKGDAPPWHGLLGHEISIRVPATRFLQRADKVARTPQRLRRSKQESPNDTGRLAA